MRKFKIIFTLLLLCGMAFAASILIPARDTFSLKETSEQLVSSLQKNIADKSSDVALPGEIDATLTNVSTKTKVLREHASNVLGVSDKNQPDQPIQERAFEYGRYLYCNQVVQDYKTRESQQ